MVDNELRLQGLMQFAQTLMGKISEWVSNGDYDEQFYDEIMRTSNHSDQYPVNGYEYHSVHSIEGDEYRVHTIEPAIKIQDVYLKFSLLLRDVDKFGRKAELDNYSVRVVDADDDEIDKLTYEAKYILQMVSIKLS